MKIKKALSKLFLATILGVGLASCGSGDGVPTSNQSTSVAISTPTTTPTSVEYNDTTVEAGKYMYLKVVYDFDKTNKKIKATEYASYSQYKNNTGTLLFEKDVKYIDYSNSHAVYFVNDNKEYYVYMDGNKTKISTKSGSLTSTSTFTKLGTVADPEYGTYVSTEFEQSKLGSDGKRIPDGNGGYEKEKFYLFVELTESTAALYAGSNSTTHNSEPLYSITNYVATLSQGHVVIEIPHTNGEFCCRLIFEESNVIDFTNYAEDISTDYKYADYSASGTLTKIS